ncbi:MAG: DoxX family protein [Parcubacteria group bacterium GW2011_GWD2_43_10]|uniref:DoxX family protein n=2 Tax=Candidatus Vebleniibacteriota TaxID=1817921 RepID=A0A1G2Q2E5_9BACT|nr:MAG: DoxX family protein [Parcubacteria group bacterium GW2011_GWA2_42_80]KKS82611.1 MAG: DoxX family protein [Parcubacteria group bacterium GW2011_GWD2_43_10]KKT15429.1 MAG: DoxX family protein [Parcubacteria group bacterium GW2011_GWF2_43_38]OHA54743.1 MAG: hypothetical protein A2226_03850 [Candidatus Veblenbacteria bacterium RIFOXYA2_FULL_43_9]OHA56650.1 MAG: hypothetical protein A2441_02495 [Candidatus Veblenbacteria bacterium RIFOXYC2_FULL_42_11]HAO81737.1 hypothetical protein [Candida
MLNQNKIWLILRLGLGFIYLWAFLDKLFGLGFSTEVGKSWLNGVSPTAGFLKFSTHGPLAGLYQALTGSGLVDWLFMLGLAGIGLGLILGIMVRIAAWGGVVLMSLMYLAIIPTENNPIIDEHIIYILVLVGLAINHKDNWWQRTKLVGKYPWLA